MRFEIEVPVTTELTVNRGTERADGKVRYVIETIGEMPVTDQEDADESCDGSPLGKR